MTEAWLVIGDFNAVLYMQDRLGGNEVHDSEVREYAECINQCELTAMRSFGGYYSWSNKARNGKRLWSKIDRAFINLEWFNLFDFTQVDYLAEEISNHAPLTIAFRNSPRIKQSFKYCDMWSKDRQFHILVDRAYQQRPTGSKMYQLTQILKRLQKPLQQLNGNRFKDVHNQLVISKAQLDHIQNQLQHDPGNRQLQEKERENRERYIDILDSSTKLMRQQSKLEWINIGDHCTNFFFCKNEAEKTGQLWPYLANSC